MPDMFSTLQVAPQSRDHFDAWMKTIFDQMKQHKLSSFLNIQEKTCLILAAYLNQRLQTLFHDQYRAVLSRDDETEVTIYIMPLISDAEPLTSDLLNEFLSGCAEIKSSLYETVGDLRLSEYLFLAVTMCDDKTSHAHQVVFKMINWFPDHVKDHRSAALYTISTHHDVCDDDDLDRYDS